MPKLSIITVNLNNLKGLQKTMQSVFAQTFTEKTSPPWFRVSRTTFMTTPLRFVRHEPWLSQAGEKYKKYFLAYHAKEIMK